MIENEQNLNRQIERLHQLTLYGRWLFVAACWLIISPLAVWDLRETISLCWEHCTWAAVRIGLEFSPVGTVAIAFCLGITTAVLVWQSSHILQGGLSPKERYRLEQQVRKISKVGSKHPLWRWVCQPQRR